MTFEFLKSQSDEIDKLVSESILSDNPDKWVIADGIIDVKRYLNSKYKILWILKEPYDERDGTGGGWDLKEVINARQTIQDFGRSKQTFNPIIYTSWGIFNEFRLWNDIPDVEDEPKLLEALKSIAYINVKKLPGLTTSHCVTSPKIRTV